MSVTQTVEIPASHRLTIDVPREVPAGSVVLTFTPASDQRSAASQDALKRSEARDIEIINRNAEWLNKEAMDFLSFQNFDL